MSRLFKGFTLNEGYTDLGTLSVDITFVESVSVPQNIENNQPVTNTSVLIRLVNDTSGNPLPGLEVNFTLNAPVGSDPAIISQQFSNTDGYVEFVIPRIATYPISDTGINTIDYEIKGVLEDRQHECYLQVRDSLDNPYYTLYRQFSVEIDSGTGTGLLGVIDGDGTEIFTLYPEIEITADITAIFISKNGQVYGYDDTLNTWSSIADIQFSQFANPAGLTPFKDWFYQVGTGGTITTGELGDGPFSAFSFSGLNPTPVLVDIAIEIPDPEGGADLYDSTLQLLPGDKNIHILELVYVPALPDDDTPSYADVETAAGITFSGPFTTFLETSSLITVQNIRRAGPLKYIEGIPDPEASEVGVLQSYVDLYFLTYDIELVTDIRTAGYTTVYDIAMVPRSTFLDDMEAAPADVFSMSRLHQLAITRVGLVSNVLAASLNDNQLVEKMNYAGANPKAYEIFAPSCGCDDCKSGISPFAYLSDLIKYAAAHVEKEGSYEPTDYTEFLGLIQSKFYQNISSFLVDCDTLHDEFCRVRLATEVLLRLKTALGVAIPAAKRDVFDKEYARYLQLTYNTLLLYMGTSFEEVRSVFTAGSNKQELSAKLAAKLKIPFYAPEELPTEILTTDLLWLSLNNPDADHELTEARLQELFGYRDVSEDVLTPTPKGLVKEWKEYELKNIWTNEDYILSPYTRQGITNTSGPTIKAEWKPIIDPDNIGISDMQYFVSDDVIGMYRHRKDDVDDFLDSYVKDGVSTLLSRTSADMQNYIVRTPEDVEGDIVYNDTVELEVAATDWDPFTLVSKTVIGTNVDFKLTTIAQPYGTTPTMRYNRQASILSFSAPSLTNVQITLSSSALDAFEDGDFAEGGYVVIANPENFPSEYYDNDTDIPTPNNHLIESVVIEPSLGFQITLEFNGAVDLVHLEEFLDGAIFAYRKEVELFTDIVPDPENDLVANLFTANSRSYTPYGGGSAVTYSVWNSVGWIPGANYAGLVSAYEDLMAQGTYPPIAGLVLSNLHLTVEQYNRMMVLMIKCQKYLEGMYTYPRPTTEELYEMASIFRVSAKSSLRSTWITEEIVYGAGATDLDLHLTNTNFIQSLTEPTDGSWDPTLQTIPSIRPIIDPEYITLDDILDGPEGATYRGLYNTRVGILASARNTMMGLLVPYDPADAFTDILDLINKGTTGSSYVIPAPYNNLANLIAAVKSNNAFTSRDATAVMTETFGLTKDEFLKLMEIKEDYESTTDYVFNESNEDLSVAADLAVLGYKRHWLWFGEPSTTWIEAESGYLYYNILKMRMAPGRSSAEDRESWQDTLAFWNKTPIIDPDIVPAENIVNFVAGDLAYDFWNERSIDYATKIEDYSTLLIFGDPASNQLDAIVALICTEIFGDASGTSAMYLFTDLETRENNGENIQPRVERLNLTMAGYRFLRKAYDLIKQAVTEVLPVPLIESEYEDIYDILLQAYKQRALFYLYRIEEYQESLVAPGSIPAGYPILLSNVEFQDYKPPINAFPLTDLPVYNTWRSPFEIRRQWLNTLNPRIDDAGELDEAWKNVLAETEDITMQVYRNALVKVLSNDCETFDEAADRLAKSLFIETKDNCCVRHTRVSQAIESLQGFLYALRNGVYDEYLDGFILRAPDFDREWAWIGSYSTWRSAMMVFIFPENILYPTLKKYQSPAFRQLARSLQDPAKLSPESACLVAQNYEDYFTDILNLDIKISANTKANVYKSTLDACCEPEVKNERIDFFFAQSKSSGKSYWSQKLPGDADYAMSFWEALNIPDQSKLIGAYPIARDHDDNGIPKRREIWFFYSYRKEGKLQLAYLKKDLLMPGSSWIEEVQVDIPTQFPDDDNTTIDFGEPFAITGCQCSIEWDWMSFIFSYKAKALGGSTHIHLRFFDTNEEFDLDIPNYPQPQVHYTTLFSADAPVTAIRHSTTEVDLGGAQLYGLSMVFKTQIVAFNLNRDQTPAYTPPTVIDFSNIKSWVGVFQKKNEPDVLIAVYRDIYNTVLVRRIDFIGYSYGTYTGLLLVDDSTYYSVTADFKNINHICPTFTQNNGFGPKFGVRVDANNAWLSSSLAFLDDTYFANDLVNLAPITNSGTDPVRIQSGHCISDFGARTSGIKDLINLNLDAPGNYFHKSSLQMEYLYEAYYFVPMLVALDQQRRGQFESALDWYRTVYDYTLNVNTNRKIFYGLVLEETLVNVFERPGDWLLDPLNPHLIAQIRANAYTRYTLMNIVQCLTGFGDREFTIDTTESVPRARQLYTIALDLLKVNEINVAANPCVAESICFPATIMTGIIGSPWENLFDRMTTELGKISNAIVLDSTREDIIGIFENVGPGYAEKFSDAFDAIADAMAGLITIPPSFEEVVEGAANRITIAMQFLDAPEYIGNVTQTYMGSVSNTFDNAVSRVSGISVENLNAHIYNSSVSQLADKDPLIGDPYTFRFMSAEGIQQMTGIEAYDPMKPNNTAYWSNLEYSNTVSVLFGGNGIGMAYAPIIDYEFCIPTNPVYNSLQMKLNVELYKIFNCRNIAGMQRELEVYGAPTDLTSNIPAIGSQVNFTFPSFNSFKPSQYRFAVLIERAKQIVQQTQQIESQFLSAMEKRDAEFYNLMKARQDLQIANSTVQLQDLRVRQSNNEKKVAELQLDRAEISQDTFDNWINVGINGYEAASLSFLSAAIVLESIAAGVYFIGVTSITGDGAAQGISALSNVASQTSSLFSQLASYERRNQEWRYQLQLANVDISIANQQIKISEDNIRIVSQEREISQLNANNANDTLEFLKNKFTNAELYNWMSNVLEGVYAYMLNLSTAVAKTAEGQLYFERQEPAGPFILDDYWENPTGSYVNSVDGSGKIDRLGLTGSARLLQDILRLDQYAFDTRKRKLQLTKNISLAQNFPEAFQRFRETGVLRFELTNEMFDYDFPGHYLRLINNVKTSVIGLVPVYGGIKASLTADPISYVVIGGNTFEQIPINRLHKDSVALTSPSNATGLFDLQQLNTELLNPFEGMGVESKWEFILPHFSNRMDYDSIADVIISIDYTALDSDIYRSFVLSQLNNQLSFSRAFSFKNNFPDQWYELSNVLTGVNEFEVSFETKRSDFPAGLNSIKASRLILYFVRESGFTDEVEVLNFHIEGDEATYSGITVNGILDADIMVGTNTPPGLSPFQKWNLKFDNVSDVNRLLFLDEKITDILFVITCDAELPNYPV